MNLTKEQIEAIKKLQKEVDTCSPNTLKYWKLRCRYLEKSIDPTYGQFERDNCFNFYRTLVKKEI